MRVCCHRIYVGRHSFRAVDAPTGVTQQEVKTRVLLFSPLPSAAVLAFCILSQERVPIHPFPPPPPPIITCNEINRFPPPRAHGLR